MANKWYSTENIWIIDTKSVGATDSGGANPLVIVNGAPIDTRDLYVKQLRWVSQTAGDTLEITDPTTGLSLYRSTANANNVGDISDGSKRRWRNGFCVPIKSSGLLYVYCE